MLKKILFWLFAIVITLGSSIYQRKTGPSYPKNGQIELKQGTYYKFELPRSHGGETDCKIELLIPDTTYTAELIWKRYPLNDEWKSGTFKREGENLVAFLPHQPPAGKLQYYIKFSAYSKEQLVGYEDPVIIRFRGDVPAYILIPHIFFIFLAMLLSNLALIMALFKYEKYILFSKLTLISIIAGGLILGPVVQKFAFGEFWTGFPNGFDLTDNKTLIAFIFWFIAVFANANKKRPYLTIVAALVMLVIFSIPHSARGSELNYESGDIKTGMIQTIKIPGISELTDTKY
ncbi:MAG: hypothetical protein JXJ22_09265 [Bacteroidales bacterium]|nr:hypothetical protein [Bacteroidales bacterium]